MAYVTHMHDPADNLEFETIHSPPIAGKGASREAWIIYASKVAVANHRLMEMIGDQSTVIRQLQAEVMLLKAQIAKRRPPGGRQPLAEAKVARLEQEIAAGGADRALAQRYHVSHMTVHRIRKRMAARERLATA